MNLIFNFHCGLHKKRPSSTLVVISQFQKENVLQKEVIVKNVYIVHVTVAEYWQKLSREMTQTNISRDVQNWITKIESVKHVAHMYNVHDRVCSLS